MTSDLRQILHGTPLEAACDAVEEAQAFFLAAGRPDLAIMAGELLAAALLAKSGR